MACRSLNPISEKRWGFLVNGKSIKSRLLKMKAFWISLSFSLFLSQSIAFCEVTEIISEGAYEMGNAETLIVGEERALLNAKRNAIEQAGTYIESYSKVENFKLTHDEIHVIAAGLMQVSIIDKKRIILENGFRIWVRIEAKVSTGKTEEFGS